jgi:putative PEP-CTERM system TPR-repeat lipoprotein
MFRSFIQYRRSALAGCAILSLFLFAAGCNQAKTADEFIKSAQSHRAASDISAAIIDLKNALQQEPKNTSARLLLGRYYLDLPDPVSAEAELLRARQDGAAKPSIAYPLARAELQMGRPERALREADVSDEIPPALGASLMAVKADAYMALGQATNASQALESGAKLDGNSVDILAATARYALLKGDVATARQRLAEAEKQDPKNAALLDLEGGINFTQQDFAASADAYKRLLATAPWSLVGRLGLARAQIADRHPQDAMANLAVVLKAAPNAPAANYLRALAAYQAKDYATAQTHIQRALNASKDSAPTLLLAGATSYALHQYEQANAYLTQYVYLVPQNVQARKLLASAQLALGRSADAVKTLSPAADSSSEDVQLLALIGTAAARTGDLAGANRYFGKALEQQPGNSAVRAELGITEMALGQTDAAIAALEEATRQDPAAIRPEVALFISFIRQKDYDKALEVAKHLKESHPDQATGFDFAGAAYLAKGDEPAGRAEFLKARELHPGDAIASRALAGIAVRSGDLATATQYYTEIITANPKDAAAYVDLAGLQERQGHQADIEATLRSGIQQNPDNAALSTLLGRVYVVQRKYREALAAVDPSLAKNPKDPALLEVAGQAQLALGNTDGALATFGKLAEALPQLGAGHRYLADAYLAAKNPDRALAEAQKATDVDPKDGRSKLTLARVLMAKGRYDEAGKLSDELAADYPRDVGVADLQGSIALDRNRPADAVPAFEKAVALADNATTRTHLAMAQAKAGHSDDAEKTLTQWLDGHPDDILPQELLGDLYVSEKRWGEAQARYEAILKKAPDTPAAENNLAWLLYRKGDAAGALTHSRHAASLAPNDPRVLDTLGMALLRNQRASDAVQTLQKAATAAPDSPEIQFHFAQALVGAGNKDKARDVLRAVLATNRTFDDRQQAQQLLQDLGS